MQVLQNISCLKVTRIVIVIWLRDEKRRCFRRFVPGKFAEESHGAYLFRRRARRLVQSEECVDGVGRRRRQNFLGLGPRDVPGQDVVEYRLRRLVVERWHTRAEFEQTYAQRPPVDRRPVSLPEQQLRGEVIGRAKYAIVRSVHRSLTASSDRLWRSVERVTVARGRGRFDGRDTLRRAVYCVQIGRRMRG